MLKKIILTMAVALSTTVPLATLASATTPAYGPVQTLAQSLQGGNWSTTESVSCSSAGNCAAAGYYDDANNHEQSFVDTETHGLWLPAVQIAGTLNAGNASRASSISCSSPGNCSVSGYFKDALGVDQAYVASEVNFVWSSAIEVGAIMNSGAGASLDSVSCATDGNCAAVGFVTVGAPQSFDFQSMVVTEVNGVWGAPLEVATVINTNYYGYMTSVSCVSSANCTATGVYEDNSGDQSFVISLVNGSWGSPLPIVQGLNTDGSGYPSAISCTTATNCTVTGQIQQYSTGADQAFAVNETNGAWGTGVLLADTLNIGQYASADALSCTSPGNCVAGGYYSDSIIVPGLRHAHSHAHSHARLAPHTVTPLNQSSYQSFVAVQSNGVWAKAFTVAGALNTGYDSAVNTVSCVDASNCVASGYFDDNSGNVNVFAVSEVAGVWSSAVQLVGVQNIDGNAETYTSSCSLDGYCVLGGFYADPVAFVISKKFAAAQFVIDPFAEGSAALTAKLNAQIWTAAALIKQHSLMKVTAIGHTDSIDTHQFNLNLGQQRAIAVRTQLLHDLKAIGDSYVMVSTATKGDTQFVASNATNAGRALNRRVVITL
jgi:outer membrane protein OmpA-like peptidoglycan-associated protein